MFIIVALSFSGVLVLAQMVWRGGINEVMQGGFELGKLINLMLNLNFILGSVLYLFATVIYFYLQTNYPFSKIQLAIVPAALILSLIGGHFIFEDRLSYLNLVGVFVISIGVFLAVHKS